MSDAGSAFPFLLFLVVACVTISPDPEVWAEGASVTLGAALLGTGHKGPSTPIAELVTNGVDPATARAI